MNPDNPPPSPPSTLPTSPGTTELLLRVRHGDRDAENRLFERYLPRLRAWTHGRLPGTARDLSDTDDLVQFALTQSFLHMDRFEPRREGAFLAYVRRILLNKIRDEARRSHHQKRREELPDGMKANDPSPLEELIGRDLLDSYETALENLTDHQKEAVILRIEFGFTYQEIAQAIEASSPDAARMLVVRGLEKLAEVLDADRA